MSHRSSQILAAVALLLSACTASSSSARSKAQSADSASSRSASASGVASDPQRRATDGKGSGSDSAANGASSGQPAESAPPAIKCERYRDCIVARVNDQIDWKCKDISTKETCQVPFYGFYHLASDLTGSVVFVAYHNGSSIPGFEQTIAIPPLPLRGNFGTSTRFLYKNEPGVSWVTFQGLLKNSKGEVVGRGAPYSFPAVP